MIYQRTILKYITLLTASLLLAACTGPFASACDDFQNYDYLRVTLPPSAEVVEEQCAPGINATYKATFTMAADDLDRLLAEQWMAQIETWQPDTTDSYLSEESWQKVRDDLRNRGAPMESLNYGQHSDGAYLTFVLIDDSDPELYWVNFSNSWVD